MVILSKVLSICSLVSMRVVYPVADLHTKVSGVPPPPPTGPNSFIFTYVFTKKHLCQRLAPPPKRVGAPQQEILDPPLVPSIRKHSLVTNADIKLYLRFSSPPDNVFLS